MTNFNITGKLAENSLEKAGITVNKNMVQFDQKSPMITSGIRIGTPAMTTRGMEENEMKVIVKFIDRVLKNPDNNQNLETIRNEVNEFCLSFPLYEEII